MSTPAVRSPGFRPDIQGLRGVAVLLVILAHAGFAGWAGGFVGVDIFFVISGFVITQLLVRQEPGQLRLNLRNFYVRRILRIVPAATALLLATAVSARLVLGGAFDPMLLVDIRWAALFSANFRLMQTSADYFVAGIDSSLITHFWSLAVEEQFYFFYPLLVFTVMRFAKPESRRHTLTVVIGLGVALSLGWSILYTLTSPVLAYYSPLTRFWELALGGLAALLPFTTRRGLPLTASLTSTAVLAGSVAMLGGSTAFPGWQALLVTMPTALLLAAGRGGLVGVNRVLALQPLRYLGDISYSLYLWHFLWLNLVPVDAVIPLPLTETLIRICGAFVCAVASYYLLENPIRHSKTLSNDGWSTLLLLGVCLALTIDMTWLLD